MNERDFENLVESIQQAKQIKKGQIPPSRVFEFIPQPDGPAQALLKVAAENPDAVKKALS